MDLALLNGWPHNLSCTVHGRDRDAVRGVLADTDLARECCHAA